MNTVLNGRAGGVTHQLLLIGLDQCRRQLRMIGPIGDAELTDVDVGLRHSRRLLGDDVESIAGADDVEIDRRVDGQGAGEQAQKKARNPRHRISSTVERMRLAANGC